ncbi:MAG: electron transport complex subunit E [Candidatus Auribacter fodinae]|jgi:electron transport complex protein RnfE|uniref:Ion-translocating oxidoreductase complex subunit E n=1 Tax=Candidatus Auribacter fodinae TaxID=2093366 RepID=A0A3A4QV51_9BACT|nr:MAG: electron transport complex subunit E [Candidatus Auribacter fodinae]
MKVWKEFKKGFIHENPTFVLTLGLCPSLATSSSLKNALGMGLSTTAVLLASNITISLISLLVRRTNTTEQVHKIRIPLYIVVIASFVTVVDFVMKGYFPALSKELGVFIPLIVVNCIILGRAEVFASKNSVLLSICDALGMGLGFTCALMLLASVRELIGAGQLFGLSVFGEGYKPALIFVLAPGAFLTIGLLMGLFKFIGSRKA